jgi:hypothetical protein
VKRALKTGALLLMLLLVAGVVAPYIRVDQYREQIRASLQRALQRKVDIWGDARLNLFRGPGFSVEKVVIHDDPSIGIEPLASVPELQTTVSLSSLWTGRLEFSVVRFLEPSLNLAKPDQGTWNLVPLVAGALASGGSVRFPEIQVSDGRIDFKLGDIKSPFYLTDTDLTVTPERDGFGISFSGAPARTDRTAGGYGLFSGRGRWSGGRLEMDVELEKSPIDDFMTLARGQTLGLHGLVASRARVSGPVSDLTLTGRLEIQDIHRWDLLQAHGGAWALNYRGTFDLGAQRFALAAEPKDNAEAPLSMRLMISQLFTKPEWRAEVSVDKMPASALIEVARHVGMPLPDGLTVDGNVAGTIAYNPALGMQGQAQIGSAALKLRDGSEFRMPQAFLEVTGDEVRLLPAKLEGQAHKAELQGSYAPFRQVLRAKLTGRGLRMTDLRNYGIPFPLANHFEGGTWSGSIGFDDDVWQAKVQLRDTTARVPGLSEPVEFVSADVEVNGGRLAVRRAQCRVGKLQAFGSYAWEPQASHPHQFSFAIPEAGIEELERLLMPALRRSGNFLARTLRLRARTPEWLRERRAEGFIRIGTLTAGEETLRAVHARVAWAGTTVRLTNIEARLEEAAIAATVVADLRESEPKYTIGGRVLRLKWKNGVVDIEGTAETSGTGIQLLARLRADGRFQARSVSMNPGTAFGTASGSFDLALSRSGPQWKLTDLEAAMGAERFSGEAATQADGTLLIDLASSGRNVSLKVDGPGAAR